MNLAKTLGGVQDYLLNGWHKGHSRLAELDRLIDALEKKEADLEKRLDQETAPLRRRHLKIELKVARMQRMKGVRRRREMESERPPSRVASHSSTMANAVD